MIRTLFFAICCYYLTACTPKIQLETPAEGITINMNVIVDHKIEVSMDEKSRAVIKTVDKAENTEKGAGGKK
ncbi:hypothetical protein A1D25_00985 [Ursidibacter arcticus]|uniref:YnbE family lipoprotein n=1 Tax=Ursidibacter arcticus TaxID=1524965 RepID=UPI0012FC0401|nr:YnbE family lipoprotein [Ursidibacter arcticus]KAE9532495.1 hypothetical protein A1D25_00985 [Ursidibacter arcticus]